MCIYVSRLSAPAYFAVVRKSTYLCSSSDSSPKGAASEPEHSELRQSSDKTSFSMERRDLDKSFRSGA
jgi:hypothetical protein